MQLERERILHHSRVEGSISGRIHRQHHGDGTVRAGMGENGGHLRPRGREDAVVPGERQLTLADRVIGHRRHVGPDRQVQRQDAVAPCRVDQRIRISARRIAEQVVVVYRKGILHNSCVERTVGCWNQRHRHQHHAVRAAGGCQNCRLAARLRELHPVPNNRQFSFTEETVHLIAHVLKDVQHDRKGTVAAGFILQGQHVGARFLEDGVEEGIGKVVLHNRDGKGLGCRVMHGQMQRHHRVTTRGGSKRMRICARLNEAVTGPDVAVAHRFVEVRGIVVQHRNRLSRRIAASGGSRDGNGICGGLLRRNRDGGSGIAGTPHVGWVVGNPADGAYVALTGFVGCVETRNGRNRPATPSHCSARRWSNTSRWPYKSRPQR